MLFHLVDFSVTPERRSPCRAQVLLLVWWFTFFVVADGGLAETPLDGELDSAVDFDRDIRPILAEACFQCHGPDEQQRQADLRLDVRAGVIGDSKDVQVVIPGQPEASEIYRRITSADEDYGMPPRESGKTLSQGQVQLIHDWIRQGAPWKAHWAFVAFEQRPLPVTVAAAARHPVDAFVVARLRREGLAASETADKTTLIRRVTLDLTGLPPSPADVEAFLADRRPDAYERLVDRLLASPCFGERMALPWLDAARYADTSGYQNDGPRDMWRWRDWVISALNHNMPFDQFTIEQLAGDMLPQATRDQIIATGFNRNHRGNAEGGIIPEEYAVEYVVDRVETTSTVWLGLTMGCARCHDHKFDPISQREFYQFYDFFNNVPEFGRAIKEGNSPPWIKAPTDRQLAQLESLDRRLVAARAQFAALQDELARAQAKWEKTFSPEQPVGWTLERGLIARYALDGTLSAECLEPRVESTHRNGSPSYVDGMVDQAAQFDGNWFVDAGDVAKFGYFDKFSIAAWIRPAATLHDSRAASNVVSRMTDTARATGYNVTWHAGHLHVNLVKRWLDDAVRVRTKHKLPVDRWSHVCVTYDGSRRADGITIYVDGQREPLTVELDLLNQSFEIDEPLRIGGGGGSDGRFSGLIDDVHIYDRELTPDESLVLSAAASPPEIARCAPDARTDAARKKLRKFYLDQFAPETARRAYELMVAAAEQRRDFWEQLPTVMVMNESEMPRQSFILQRGQYDQPGEPVSARTPSCLPPMKQRTTANRLGLAQWIVDPANPLTARVAVNRYWQTLFGVGLVETPEDFGSQGARPTHPRLLDWLASEFVGSGWDFKSLLRTIVTSSTYRQSSRTTADLLLRDPKNRLLSRGPRVRLRAEVIRDQALAASGLLVQQIGGPSVRPYQPDGLWKEIASVTDYQQSQGAGLYRRSIYTYWKRTVSPPAMMTFDAATRETCVVRPSRTNTPLQALTLLNDITFLECSRALAQQIMVEPQASPEQRIKSAFRRVTGRGPTPAELTVLVAGFIDHQSKYRDDPAAARELVRLGNSPVDASTDPVALAAYMVVSNVILNLDETVTRE